MTTAAGFSAATPGITDVRTTVERNILWGPAPYTVNRFASGVIASATVDAGNTPTTILRPGLVLGIITASGKWTHYSPTATDGSQVAQGVLLREVNMMDPTTNAVADRFMEVVVGGPIKSAELYGLDLIARAQLSQSFNFDDDYAGHSLPWKSEVAKTADYTVVAADRGKLFTNAGAAGAVNFTLPALAAGFRCQFLVVADQNVTITSAAGNDIVTFNDAAASSISFQTAGKKIGGWLEFVCNAAGTKWYVREMASGGAYTYTIV